MSSVTPLRPAPFHDANVSSEQKLRDVLLTNIMKDLQKLERLDPTHQTGAFIAAAYNSASIGELAKTHDGVREAIARLKEDRSWSRRFTPDFSEEAVFALWFCPFVFLTTVLVIYGLHNSH